MKHLPCIPDEVLPLEDRQNCYRLEQTIEATVAGGRVVELVDPQNLAGGYRYLLLLLDELAGAYLEMARDRDQWKNVCDLAYDGEFWQALELLKETR